MIWCANDSLDNSYGKLNIKIMLIIHCWFIIFCYIKYFPTIRFANRLLLYRQLPKLHIKLFQDGWLLQQLLSLWVCIEICLLTYITEYIIILIWEFYNMQYLVNWFEIRQVIDLVSGTIAFCLKFKLCFGGCKLYLWWTKVEKFESNWAVLCVKY